MNTKYGLKFEPIKPEDYTLGGFSKLPREILQKDGQWDLYLPVAELQKIKNVETQNCTGFATTSAIEILIKRKYNR